MERCRVRCMEGCRCAYRMCGLKAALDRRPKIEKPTIDLSLMFLVQNTCYSYQKNIVHCHRHRRQKCKAEIKIQSLYRVLISISDNFALLETARCAVVAVPQSHICIAQYV